jgi:hypothetical protein
VSPRLNLGFGSSNGGPAQLYLSGSGPAGSWTLASHVVDASGRRVGSGRLDAFVAQYCPHAVAPPGSRPGIARLGVPDGVRACLARAARTFDVAVDYQPQARYWAFQWLESGIFVALALAAFAGASWWVCRRAA